MNLESSAIRRVSYYMAGQVETCDRCSTVIKHVFAVSYKDGQVQKYGSECINKILNNEPKLKTLFKKNSELLKKYQDYLEIFNRPVEDMPRGQEYFGSGLYFIADSNGKDITFGHYFFHPVYDDVKNGNGQHYVIHDDGREHVANAMQAIERDKVKLQAEITRLELFLARVMRSANKPATV